MKGLGQGGGFCHEFINNHFCISWVMKQIVYLNSATCLGDLCVAINSLGKPAVGGSECT